jgi:hypothetical protein
LFARRKFVATFNCLESVAVVWRRWFTRVSGEFVRASVIFVARAGDWGTPRRTPLGYSEKLQMILLTAARACL